MMVILLGCGMKKRSVISRAVDLYVGPLYRKRLTLARKLGGPHWILSAKHRVISPSHLVAPYDVTLSRMSKVARIEWGNRVAGRLLEVTKPGDSIVVLAGMEYVRSWRDVLEREGRIVDVPIIGPLGCQMRELTRRSR